MNNALAASQRLPTQFSPYVVEWGEDDYGVYQILELFGLEHVFRWIPPGTFQMGSAEDEKDRDDDEVQHWVMLSEGFWLGETVVSQAQWKAVQENSDNPSHFKGDDLPVEQVSWHDCDGFIKRLNTQYPELAARLPTEAEWEYACRAGTSSAFNWGESIHLDVCNYGGNWEYDKNTPYAEGALQKTCAVKAYQPNAWGLYQMHGNVWEWCHDCYGDYPKAALLIDPEGLTEAELKEDSADRVLRGGSWGSVGRSLRSARRSRSEPGWRLDSVGFRLALGRELKGGGAASNTRQ